MYIRMHAWRGCVGAARVVTPCVAPLRARGTLKRRGRSIGWCVRPWWVRARRPVAGRNAALRAMAATRQGVPRGGHGGRAGGSRASQQSPCQTEGEIANYVEGRARVQGKRGPGELGACE